jgi:hypothetical protein
MLGFVASLLNPTYAWIRGHGPLLHVPRLEAV